MSKISPETNQRVGIFIDVQNLYHSAKNLYRGGRVNYGELMKHLVGDRQLIRALAYVVRSEIPGGEHGGTDRLPSGEGAFFEALHKSGLDLRSKDLQTFGDGTKKGDWDVGLAVDAIRMSNHLDVIVLVTGDGDFIPLVEYLRWGMGRIVEVAAFKRSCSMKLQESVDRFINVEDIPRIIIRGTAATTRHKNDYSQNI